MKKTPGKERSNIKEIKKYADSDFEFLHEEFKLINPEVVVCGGTFSIIKELFEINSHSINNDGKIYFANGRFFIDYWHPAARYRSESMYNDLCSLFKRCL